MAQYQSYIICTTPRSGSTLLCKLLGATGISGIPASYFHDPSISDWLSELNLTPDHTAAERDILKTIFEAARACGTGKTGMFGLRLQRRSFAFFMEQLGVLHPGFSTDLERLQAVFGPTLFISLNRRNKLEQAISLVKATQTGLWHMAPDGTELERLSAPREPAYDADEIARSLAELTGLNKDWDEWFARQNIEPLRIAYEELSADPAEVLASILDRLGLDRNAARGVSPAVAKLADTTSRKWLERFQAERGDTWGGQP